MKFLIFLKMYLWPFPVSGSIKLSDDGRNIHQRKMDAWLKGKDYAGPRASIHEQSDERARAHNRQLVIPILPNYIKRWVLLTLTWCFLGHMAAKNDAVVLEAIFTIMLLCSGFITMGFTWLLRDLKGLEREKMGSKL